MSLLATAVSAAMIVTTPAVGASSANGSGKNVLTEAIDLSGASGDPVTFDVSQSHVPGDQVTWNLPIYDSLLRYTPSGALVPELATAATIADPSTIDVTLRPHVVFSDGTPFDATAVKDGILRNEQAPKHGQFDSTLYDVSTIDVITPTSLVIHLSQPVAGAFYPLLAGEETFIPSPTAAAKGNLASHPVGAGPFLLKQYVPDQKIVLVANPKYWNAKAIKISRFEMISTQGATQQLDALQAGSANLAVGLPASDAPAIRNSGSLRVALVASPISNLWMPLCKSTGPLSNVRVRQALNYAVDRNAIVSSLLQGAGRPQWALWPQGNVYYPSDLTGIYKFNVTKAKRLLARAGYAKGFGLTLVELPGDALTSQVAQVIQQEWRRIGVDVTIKPSSSFVTDLYVNHAGQTSVLPTVRGGLQKLTGSYGPESIGNLCSYSSPTLNALATRLSALAPNSRKAVALWKTAQRNVVKNALSVFIAWTPDVVAYGKNVKKLSPIASYLIPIPNFWSVRVSG